MKLPDNIISQSAIQSFGAIKGNKEQGMSFLALVIPFTPTFIPSPAQEYGLPLAFFIFSIPVSATVDFMVSRIGRIGLKSLKEIKSIQLEIDLVIGN